DWSGNAAARRRGGRSHAGWHRQRGGPPPVELAVHHVEHDGGAGPHRRAGQHRRGMHGGFPVGGEHPRRQGQGGGALSGRRAADGLQHQAVFRRGPEVEGPAPAGDVPELPPGHPRCVPRRLHRALRVPRARRAGAREVPGVSHREHPLLGGGGVRVPKIRHRRRTLV
ncbi:MAG: ABC-type dipeptide transport system, periplasmic component, partial [uncultured Rubrobacteraceae bacterium]